MLARHLYSSRQEKKCAVFLWRTDEGYPGVMAACDLVAEHVEQSGGDVELVRQGFDAFALHKASRRVDDERHLEPFLVDGVVVLEEVVLPECLPVVAVDHEDRVLV